MEDWPSIFDSSTRIQRGLCPVTQIRHTNTFTSHSLYFEEHGTGPEKVVFIMGLNSSSFAWASQISHFGQLSNYTCLVFDNRGVGYSGVPPGPFTTSAMAQDVVALLDYVEWKEERGVHIVGLSLGGMIAQEVADLIPERIASLTLGVTTPGGHAWNNLPPWTGFRLLLKATITTDVALKIPSILDMVFSQPWLNEKSIDHPKLTNREVQAELRFSVTRKQPLWGSIFQMYAGLTHYVSPERLRKISSHIPKVVLVTGDDDHLVHASNTLRIKASMPEAELVQWSATGHGIHYQRKHEFNALLERTIKEGRERS
ncbi:alpha/beta-hydrolase [Hymenopellis radicata]|nr:alpha/beta-hydrolase [Hymenopellis radicata]